MECRIKGNHLRHRWKNRLHSPDSKKVGRIVERSEIAAYLNLLHHILIDKGTCREELTAVHNPVSYGLNVIERLENTVLRICKRVKNEFHSDLVVRDRKVNYIFILPCGGMLEASGLKTDFLHEALREDIIHVVILHVKQLILD